MRRFLRVLGAIGGILLVLIALAVVAVYVLSNRHINKQYTITPAAVPVPTDAAAITEGERLVTIRGCNSCHGANLGGMVMIDGVPGHIVAPNLTQGEGGLANVYTDVDWVRAIRHGVTKAGRGIWMMPANDFNAMSDADTGKIIAYVKSMPPVDNELGPSRFGIIFRALLSTGQTDFIAAEQIDHNATVSAPLPSVTVEYGRYLSTNCQSCHGPKMAGGISVQPGSPLSANLTPAGDLKNWNEAQFITTLRTGKLPNGRQLDNTYMPWQAFAQLKDDEVKALWLYIKALPPVSTVSNN